MLFFAIYFILFNLCTPYKYKFWILSIGLPVGLALQFVMNEWYWYLKDLAIFEAIYWPIVLLIKLIIWDMRRNARAEPTPAPRPRTEPSFR